MKQRNYFIDVLKGVAILAVVVFHTTPFRTFPIISYGMYAAFMPLFFILTGYVMYSTHFMSIAEWSKERAVQLLVPHVLLDISWALLSVLGMSVDSAYYAQQRSITYWLTAVFAGYGAEWFFLTMFVVSLFVFNLVTVERRVSTKVFWTYLTLTTVLFVAVPLLFDVWLLREAQWYYPFAVLGMLIAKYPDILRRGRYFIGLCATIYIPVLISTPLAGAWYERAFLGLTVHMFLGDYITWPLAVIQSILGTCFTVTIAYELRNIIGSVLASIGRYTLAIYFVHTLVCNLGFGVGIWRIITSSAISLVTCFVVIFTLNRFSWANRWVPLWPKRRVESISGLQGETF